MPPVQIEDMLVKKKDSVKEIGTKECSVWDYRLPEKDLGISVQKITSRFPKTGWSRNSVCKEVCFILSGSGIVCVENKAHKVSRGDVVVINPGEKSYAKAKSMEILVVTSPDWYPDQCEFLEK